MKFIHTLKVTKGWVMAWDKTWTGLDWIGKNMDWINKTWINKTWSDNTYINKTWSDKKWEDAKGDRPHIHTGMKPCVNLLYFSSNEHVL